MGCCGVRVPDFAVPLTRLHFRQEKLVPRGFLPQANLAGRRLRPHGQLPPCHPRMHPRPQVVPLGRCQLAAADRFLATVPLMQWLLLATPQCLSQGDIKSIGLGGLWRLIHRGAAQCPQAVPTEFLQVVVLLHQQEMASLGFRPHVAAVEVCPGESHSHMPLRRHQHPPDHAQDTLVVLQLLMHLQAGALSMRQSALPRVPEWFLRALRPA